MNITSEVISRNSPPNRHRIPLQEFSPKNLVGVPDAMAKFPISSKRGMPISRIPKK